jgi:hypothetical protein
MIHRKYANSTIKRVPIIGRGNVQVQRVLYEYHDCLQLVGFLKAYKNRNREVDRIKPLVNTLYKRKPSKLDKLFIIEANRF